ncbi:unnamed protein product [Heterobilharzia americana]|nr:unnamed protein product [Heterobilharzia americana]CAH8287757.1 unnamed protein product [Heterobilharzia americana]
MAVSGIDRSIKIIEPDPNVYQEDDDDGTSYDETSTFRKIVKQHEEEASELCQTNEMRTKQILVSGNNHLDSIARIRTGRVARMILQRIVQGTSDSAFMSHTDTETNSSD